MSADNSIRFQPVKVQKNMILRHKLLNNLPQKYKFSVHPICTALKNIRFRDFIANYQVVLMLYPSSERKYIRLYNIERKETAIETKSKPMITDSIQT